MAKEKNATVEKKQEGWGDCWTWTAIDADTKLIPCWMVGTREASTACHFIHDVKDLLAARVQLTTDGHKAYLGAVEDAFGAEVDYAMLIKIHGTSSEGGERALFARTMHGSAQGCHYGQARPEARLHGFTSFVERANLTMRMGMRRFTPANELLQ